MLLWNRSSGPQESQVLRQDPRLMPVGDQHVPRMREPVRWGKGPGGGDSLAGFLR